MSGELSRAGGVLLPLFSLPSPYGVGSLGRAAYDFLEQLHQAGQSWWQLLPMGPTGYGDSPYQSLSSQAGNPYFIDLDLLCDEDLLDIDEVEAADWGEDPGSVDYGALFRQREPLLSQAWQRVMRPGEKQLAAHAQLAAAFRSFVQANTDWLEDYALYAALKQEFDYQPWYQWPEPLRKRHPWALTQARLTYADSIDRQRFFQFIFFRQWRALRKRAGELGIKLLGDLPLYCAMDSADVWAATEQFRLDGQGRPLAVAGCPPDDFSPEGQLWGNPLYAWEEMRANGFAWWRQRIRHAAQRFDGLRLDHFRGLEAYWSIPVSAEGAASAKDGCWQPGPGEALLQALIRECPDTLIISEDLGFLTPQVHHLRQQAGLPGMKVLQFAFGQANSPYLPHNFERDCVCYAGTHDNPPLHGWISEAGADTLSRARDYLGLTTESTPAELAQALLRAGCASVAGLFILQLQDLLGLDSQARINQPGSTEGNWRWRLLPGQFGPKQVEELAHLTRLYGRG